MTAPYYQDELVTLYHGDYRDHLTEMGGAAAVVTDPPYGETSLAWDAPGQVGGAFANPT